MSVAIECTCGKRLKAKDEAAGKTGRCPACGAAVTFPPLVKVAESPVLNFDPGDEDPFSNPVWSRPAEVSSPSPASEAKVAVKPKEPKVRPDWKRKLHENRRVLTIGGALALTVVVAFVTLTGENPEFKGKKFSEWRRQLKDTNVQTRIAAIHAIGGIGRNGHNRLVIPTLVGEVQTTGPLSVCDVAASELAEMGDDFHILKAMIDVLPQTKDRRTASALIKGIGNGVRRRGDYNAKQVGETFQALKHYVGRSDIGDKAEAVPVIEHFVESSDKTTSAEAIELLGILLADKSSVSKVIPVFYNYSGLFGGDLTRDLGPAMPHLVRFVKQDLQPDSESRSGHSDVIQILAVSGHYDQSVPALISLVEENNYYMFTAIDTLGKIGPPAKSAVPVLQRLMRDPKIPPNIASDLQRIIKKLQGSGS